MLWPKEVTGVIADKSGSAKVVLRGTWDDTMEAAKVLGGADNSVKPVFETGEYKVVWKRKMPPPYLEKCYNFTQMAVELNEIEDGIAPTDSRLRPDLRLMEEARWEEANSEKVRLEEKQRAARRQREKDMEKAAAEGKTYPEYEPVWFKRGKDPITGNLIHMYNSKYWEHKKNKDWSLCPHIY